MGFLTSGWVKYWDRAYASIKASIAARMTTATPEITDLNESNPYIKEMDTIAGIHEGLGYYVDNAARETTLQARLYKSMIYAAQSNDYKVVGNIPYTADVVFSTTVPVSVSDLLIPAGTLIRTSGGIQYITQNDATITVGNSTSNSVGASQYIQKTGVYMGDATGAANMQVTFDEQVAHNSIVLTIGTDSYTSVDSLAYYGQSDKVFVQTVDENGNVIIYTGNGMQGVIPVSGAAINADYKVTMGASGFADIGEINTVVSTIPGYTVNVTNPVAASGGSDVEDINSLKNRIPLSLKTLSRAVRKEDYLALAVLAPGVSKAGIYFNCGKSIILYIVPTGGGIASSALCTSTYNYIYDKKAVGTKITILPAGSLHILISADITAKTGYVNDDVKATALAAILAQMGPDNQDINGQVVIGDIYQAIEDSDGVLNSVITKFVPVPYAQPIAGTHTLNWTPAINTVSNSIVIWNIVFVSSTTYKLIRSGIVLGTFTVGTNQNIQEINMTLNAGTYSNGDTFQFVTYPYNANKIILNEPSLPVSISTDIALTVTGGI